MCNPNLKLKAMKAIEMLLGDEGEEERDEGERSKLKVMNYITGHNQALEDAVINRADDLYVAK